MKSFEEILIEEERKSKGREEFYMNRRIQRMNRKKAFKINNDWLARFLFLLVAILVLVVEIKTNAMMKEIQSFEYKEIEEFCIDIPEVEENEERIEFENSEEFLVTYYCGCSKCCGKWSLGDELICYGCKGDKLTPFVSIASDPNVLSYGQKIYDEYGNEYIVQDTGSLIKGNRIDVFVGNHEQALKLGTKYERICWNEKY